MKYRSLISCTLIQYRMETGARLSAFCNLDSVAFGTDFSYWWGCSKFLVPLTVGCASRYNGAQEACSEAFRGEECSHDSGEAEAEEPLERGAAGRLQIVQAVDRSDRPRYREGWRPVLPQVDEVGYPLEWSESAQWKRVLPVCRHSHPLF